MKKSINKIAIALGFLSTLFGVAITALNDLLPEDMNVLWKYIIIIGFCLIIFIITVLIYYIISINSKPINVGDILNLQTILDSILENEKIVDKLTTENDPQKRKIYLYKMVCNYENLIVYEKTHKDDIIKNFALSHKDFLKQHINEMDQNCQKKFKY